MLNIDYLREFAVLANTGKFNEAAEQLYIAQSSLSKHIMALEKELDTQLFNRTTHTVELTRAGRAILPYVQRIVDLRGAMDQELLRLKHNDKRSTIVIGSAPVVPLYRLSNLMNEFLRQYDCEIQIRNQSVSELKSMLYKSRFDFIITYDNGSFGDSDITSIPYTDDRLSAVVSSSHPLAKCRSVKLKDLQGESFIKIGADPIIENFVYDAYWPARRFDPEADFIVDTVQQMLSIIHHGMAITLMGQQSVKHFADQGVVAVPIEPIIPLHVKLFYLQPYLKDIANRILNYLKASNDSSAM